MGHNMSMDSNNSGDFNKVFLDALKEKEDWLNSTLLPKIHDEYRLHATCLNTLMDALIKKSLITPDPYQKDKKITQIQKPEDTPFSENERSIKLGLRLCDYQAMIDYVCNYLKFSTDQLNLDKIQRLLDLNSTIHWNNLTANSPKMNTQALAVCIAKLKSGTQQQLQIAMINDSVNKSQEAITEINAGLKQVSDFAKERYKGEVRSKILQNPKFDASQTTSPSSFLAEIKKHFPQAMPKRPFSNELIEEIIQEETSQNKEALRQKALAKLRIEEVKTVSKTEGPNSHDVLMDAIRSLGTASEQYEQVIAKIMSNNNVLQSGHNTTKDKILRLLRKIFGLPEPEIDYTIVTTDGATHTQKREKLNYTEFIQNLAKRSKFYSGMTVKNSQNYNKIASQDEKKAFDWLNKQMTENTRIQTVLAGLDTFFKSSAEPSDRSKIKGISMELTSLKNILLKTNQIRAEYAAYVEEREQMKNLGITQQ